MLSQMKIEVSILISKNETLQEQIKQSNKEKEDLTNLLKTREDQLILQATTIINHQNYELDRNQLQKYQLECFEWQEKMKKLSQELESSNWQLNKVKEQLEYQSKVSYEKEKENATFIDKINVLEKDIVQREKVRMSLQDQLKDLSTNMGILNDKMKSMTTECEAERQQHQRNLATQKLEYVAESERLQAAVTAGEKQIEQLQIKLSEKMCSEMNLKARFEEVLDTMKSQSVALSQAEIRLSEWTQARIRLEEMLARAEYRAEKSIKRLEESEKSLEHEKAVVKGLRGLLLAKAKEVEQPMNASISTLKEEIQEKNIELDRLRCEIAVMTGSKKGSSETSESLGCVTNDGIRRDLISKCASEDEVIIKTLIGDIEVSCNNAIHILTSIIPLNCSILSVSDVPISVLDDIRKTFEKIRSISLLLIVSFIEIIYIILYYIIV